MARTARLLLTLALLQAVLTLPAARAQNASGSPPVGAPVQPARPDTAQVVDQSSPSLRDGISPPPRRPDAANVADQLVDDIQNRTLPAPLPESAAAAPAQAWEPEFLKTLPQPPDQPRSLFQAPPPIGPPPPNLERYFEADPLLDPPPWGKIGPFADVRLDVIHPQLFFGQMRLLNSLKVPSGQRVIVAPGAGVLPWTVAPRLEIGYRLPSGFGGFSFSDRFFSSEGIGPFVGPAGSTTRTTRLGTNYSDWDYISREFTPWNTSRANWTLEWRAGIRLQETWATVRVDKPFDEAAATNRVFIQGDSNYTVGAGPHFGLAVDRKDIPTGLSFVMKLDIADTFTRVRQLFAASTTTIGADGRPERGAFTQNFWNQVPILNYQVGIGWTPPANPNISLYMGYVYEFWWQLASNMNFLNPFTTQGATRGSMDNQGLFFQAQVKF
jgi:hypothetical protein